MRRLESRIQKLEAKGETRAVCNVLIYDPRKTTAQAVLAEHGVPGVRYMLVADHGSDAEWEAALRFQQRELRRRVYEGEPSTGDAAVPPARGKARASAF